MSSLDGQSTQNDVFKKFHTFKENPLTISKTIAQFQCKIDLSPSTESFECWSTNFQVIEMACNLSKENQVETISKILPFAELLCTLTIAQLQIHNAKIKCFETVMHYHLYLSCLLKYHVDQVEASSKPEDQWSCKRSPEICFIYQ